MHDAIEITPPEDMRITAPSERDAMDWSLVLLSQGIEPTLVRDDASGQWQLVVPPNQLVAGRASIQQYERENHAWPLRHPLPWPGLAFDWAVLAWVLLLSAFFSLQIQPGSALQAAGYCDSDLVRSGAWWRLLTATMLHADIGHLATNAVFGAVLLGLVMGRFGTGVGWFAATFAGAAGNALAILWHQGAHRSLGASGVVFATLGLLTADTMVQQFRHQQPRRLVISSLAGGLMLFVLYGVAPETDVAAHFAGFLAGLVIGFPLGTVPVPVIRRSIGNWLAGAIMAGLIVVAWWLALRAA